MTITVIHGAPATGKTHHAERLRSHYQCGHIFEEWDPQGASRQRDYPGRNALVLTQCSPDVIRHHLGSGVRIVAIEQALRAIGCGQSL